MVKKSRAAKASQCASKKVFQGVRRLRSGAGSMPWSLGIHLAVFRFTVIPRLSRESLIRVYPQDGLSFAIRTVISEMLSRILGRPEPRLAAPSYLLATRCLNQLKKRVRGDDCSELLEGLPSQCLGLCGQSTPLLISESDPTALEMFPVHVDLLEEIVDDFLLISVDPARCKKDGKP